MKRYYKTCLWSPIWLPLLLLGFGYALENTTGNFYGILPEWLGMIGFVVAFSILFGGIQYLITLVIIWRQIDFNEFKSWLKWILLLPLIFTPIQILVIWICYWIVAGKFVDLNESFGFISFDLFVAYGYVAVWLLGYGGIRFWKQNFSEDSKL